MQTESHWCTFGTFTALITRLAAHAKWAMEQRGLDWDRQHFIVVLDCYSVHISEEFLAWAKEK